MIIMTKQRGSSSLSSHPSKQWPSEGFSKDTHLQDAVLDLHLEELVVLGEAGALLFLLLVGGRDDVAEGGHDGLGVEGEGVGRVLGAGHHLHGGGGQVLVGGRQGAGDKLVEGRQWAVDVARLSQNKATVDFGKFHNRRHVNIKRKLPLDAF